MNANISLVFAAAFLSASASATVIFQDNFDSEAGAAGNSSLNYNSFLLTGLCLTAQLTLFLMAVGASACAGGTGKCVDLDGSTNDAGVFTSKPLSLAAGTYSFSFDISGNQTRWRSGLNDNDIGGVQSII